MGWFSSKNASDNAAEAILTLDLSHSQTERWAAVDHLQGADREALRSAIGELPDTKGREVAQANLLRKDQNARDEQHAAEVRRRYSEGKSPW